MTKKSILPPLFFRPVSMQYIFGAHVVLGVGYSAAVILAALEVAAAYCCCSNSNSNRRTKQQQQLSDEKPTIIE